MKTILLVGQRPAERRKLGEMFERNGVEVMCCPGPRSPGFLCAASLPEGCPLAKGADAVVLQAHEPMCMEPWTLARYYLDRGIPVVAIADPEDMDGGWELDIRLLPARTDARSIMAAVADAVAS